MVREPCAKRETVRSVTVLGLLTLSVAFVASLSLYAIEPPTPAELQQMTQDGVLEARLARAETLGLYRFGAGLEQKAVRKVQIEALNASPGAGPAFPFGGPFMAFPYTRPPELVSEGRVKTLTILVDFNDLRAEDDPNLGGMDTACFQNNIYGKGTDAAQDDLPYESLRSYYRRASHYGEDEQGNVVSGVDVDGSVLGWCHLQKDRDGYEPTAAGDAAWNRAILDLAVEALTPLDASEDFAQYDNDGDGDIDLITIIYAGPPTGWMSFWWAYRWEFFVPEMYDHQFDDKHLRQFVFQFASKRSGNDFNPNTLIHEMGHAFGLPDYYDYRPGYPSPSVDGGVGGLDMMDANQGNHNAFSRWLLDWIAPEVIGSATPARKVLCASGSSNGSGAVAVFPGLVGIAAPGQELFIIENRHRLGNDEKMPGNGILVWHVDATPKFDNSGFLMNNSYTAHKLLRLVRANNPTDFADGEWAESGCYYNTGEVFTPSSSPDSRRYDGTPTGVSMTDLSANGEEITAEIGIVPGHPGGTPTMVAAAPPEVTPPPTTLAAKMAAQRDQPIDLADAEQFLVEFQRAFPKELEQAWAENFDEKRLSGPADQNTFLSQILLTRLAAKDGKAAVKILQQLPSGVFRSQVSPSVLEAWAHNDTKGAATWYLAPRQRELRKSTPSTSDERSSESMKRFAETIYQWSAMRDPAKAVSAVDDLDRMPEIEGAVRGVLQANELIGRDAQQLGQGIEDLKKNRDTAEAFMKIQNAEREIQNPEKRMEFRQLMQQRGLR